MDDAIRKLLAEVSSPEAQARRRRIRFEVEIDAAETLIAFLESQLDRDIAALARRDHEQGRDLANRAQPFREDFMNTSLMRLGLEHAANAIGAAAADAHLRKGVDMIAAVNNIAWTEDNGGFRVTITNMRVAS